MAVPDYNFPINNVLATTLDAQLPEIVDSIYGRIPLIQRLYQRFQNNERLPDGTDPIMYDGGDRIRATILYNKFVSDSYGKGQTFDTSFPEFLTQMIFEWKRVYAPINVDALDLAKNAGSLVQVINFGEALARNGVMSLADELDNQIVAGDGTGNGGLDFDGLGNGVAATGTYGGITRNSTVGDPGSTIKANINSVGGPFSFSMLNDSMTQVTFGKIKPDLILTTVALWSKIWARSQVSERNTPGPMREVGFDTIKFNGAEVIADDYVPSGYIYLLNTSYIQLWLMKGYDFVRRGAKQGAQGFPVYNQDAFVDQIICYGNLIVNGPRFQARISNVT